ncbi:MAG TPA: pepsin-like aspartic protease [Thermoplasmata archaeon]|nr:pepsin-like aspartic protease [Thermoplasmata archaeon]
MARKVDAAVPTPRPAVRVPITNVYGAGDYTAQVAVGSQNAAVNLILDTGSSTLAVKQGAYQPRLDQNLQPSPYAQEIRYGTGGWAGPVVTTTVTMGSAGTAVTLRRSPMAIAAEQQPHNFGAADGILGLAYNALNTAANLTAYLQQRGVQPAVTYPWPFPVTNSSAALAQLEQLFDRMPQEDIPPYFTELETDGITANKFAFYTLRSVPSAAGPTPGQNPLNRGVFVLGGGEEQTDLYAGAFANVAVEDDAWYNTNLIGVEVGGGAPIPAAALPAEAAQSLVSNSIVDSGTNSLALAKELYDAIVAALNALDPTFGTLIAQASESPAGIPTAQLELADWPPIRFVLTGDAGENVTLTCAPSTYWQVDAPSVGRALFQVNPMGAEQSILGLPLLNNYYTVFDRSLDPYGTIRFAPIRATPAAG